MNQVINREQMSMSLGTVLLIVLNTPRIFLHIICYICTKNRQIIKQDLLVRPAHRSLKPKLKDGLLLWPLCLSLLKEPEFRNVFYLRIGFLRHFLNLLLPKVTSMRLSRSIGPGFCPVHSYSTIVNGATRIGQNCTILQNVTIGIGKGGVPTIGNNVNIGAGAIILGGITIGNNVRIGAGAIVVEDVPDNCTVICEKARIIYKPGQTVSSIS